MKKYWIVALCIILVAAITSCILFIPPLFKKESVPTTTQVSAETLAAKQLANLSNPAIGFCEAEADALREKILNTENTESYYQITGTKYYVSSSEGDDNNEGTSPDAPIKSIERIKELYLADGDAILFKRGDVFRFGETLVARKHITYGSYGEGAKPKIYGSPENYAQSDKWENEMGDVWKIPFDYPEACGLVINHSEIIGINKSKGIRTLNANGDYYHDTESGIFYLYSDKGNPSEAYTDIEIMPSFYLVSARTTNTGITIDNICFKYSAGSGVSAISPKDFTVTNCEFGFCGGWWLDSSTKDLRFGNSVEFWGSGINLKVENNWIYQTYDSGITWQGREGNSYVNISFSNNLLEYNNADIEFFDRNNAKLENFRMENNIMRFTSMGWGTRTNDGGIRGIEGCIRALSDTNGMDIKSVYFTNNIIDCPARQTINWNWELYQREFIHTSGTKLYIKGAYRTLDYYLQGLQTEEDQTYERKFAKTYEDLVEGIKIFDESAEVHYED